MTIGSRLRRASVLVFLLAASGCNSVPIGQLAPSPNRPRSALAVAGRTALLPATLALDEPSEMASIERSGAGVGAIEMSPRASDPSRQALTSPELPPQPTPLLDAALERANAISINDAVSSEAPREAEAPVLPARLPPPPTFPDVPKPPEPVAEAKVEEAPRPEDAWREGVRKLVGLTKARGETSGDPNSPWPLRSKVMAWLAEPDIDPDFGSREPDPVRSVLRALEARTPRGDQVRSAVRAIEERAPLEIVELKLCSKVERFGDFKPMEPVAGQPVVVYCEVDGLGHDQTASGFRTRLAGQVEILAEVGGPPLMARPLGTAQETCARRRRDYYVPYVVQLPTNMPPGDYKLRVQLTDLVAGRSASRDVSFSIAPH